MSMFRSVVMKHKNLRLPRDHAVQIMDKLGRVKDGIEFIDLNKNLLEGQKNFFGMIKRCNESEGRISRIETICNKYNKTFVKFKSYNQFLEELDQEEMNSKKNNALFFDLVEHELIEDEKKLNDLTSNYDRIAEDLDHLKEKKAVYDKLAQLLANENSDFSMNLNSANLYNINSNRNSALGNSDDETGNRITGIQTMAGVINSEDEIKMKRMIFRVSRGRATPSFFDLELRSSASKEKLIKKIYTIFFPSSQDNILLSKLIKICDMYNASRISIPNPKELKNEILNIQKDISIKDNILKESKTSIDGFIRSKIGNENDNIPSKYELYLQYFKKEKAIYNNLNRCKLTDNFVEGAVWVPEEMFPKIQEQLNKISADLSLSASFGDLPPTSLSPPTYINTNELTWVFQEITDAYGVPRYREINPSLYSIVTFPFLFGVMFGDIGHGGLLLLFGLYLVFWADDIQKSNSPLKVALKVRYMLLLMGIFAFYCGFMYNDFLSIPLNIFGSCYENVSLIFYLILL